MITKAKESTQIQKARQKLSKQLSEENKRLNTSALNRTTQLIRRWISRHSNERVTLKGKQIKLFDENKHSEKAHSKYVNRLLQQIKHKIVREPSMKSLEGRIKKAYS